MAMLDRRDHPAVAASLKWLKDHAASEPSTMALSLATVGLQAAGEAAVAPRSLLVRQEQGTRSFGNWHLIAMALYALTSAQHRVRALVV